MGSILRELKLQATLRSQEKRLNALKVQLEKELVRLQIHEMNMIEELEKLSPGKQIKDKNSAYEKELQKEVEAVNLKDSCAAKNMMETLADRKMKEFHTEDNFKNINWDDLAQVTFHHRAQLAAKRTSRKSRKRASRPKTEDSLREYKVSQLGESTEEEY